jgi:hypothetical protein
MASSASRGIPTRHRKTPGAFDFYDSEDEERATEEVNQPEYIQKSVQPQSSQLSELPIDYMERRIGRDGKTESYGIGLQQSLSKPLIISFL